MPTLTATPQQLARVLLALTWPGIQTVTIQRLDPDGQWRTVRNAEPAVCLGATAAWDHEAPLDASVTYRATSAQGAGAVNANVYFESGITNWTGANGATLASSGTQHHEGALALRLTPNGTSNGPNAQAEEIACVPGQVFGASAWAWVTTASTWLVGVAWYNASHGFVSTSSTSVALAAATWTPISGTFAAPAGAAFGRLVIQGSGVPAGTNILYIDEAMMTSPAALTVASTPVTVPSGGKAWLSHPGHPRFAAATVVRDLQASYAGRAGSFWPIASPLPVVVTDVRGGGQGAVTWQAATPAEYQRIRSLIADGAVLLMRLPATWSGDCWYVSVDTIVEDRFSGIATDGWRRYQMPFTRVDRPAGASDGAVGQTWADVKATYATFNALTATGKTCAALAQSVT